MEALLETWRHAWKHGGSPCRRKGSSWSRGGLPEHMEVTVDIWSHRSSPFLCISFYMYLWDCCLSLGSTCLALRMPVCLYVCLPVQYTYACLPVRVVACLYVLFFLLCRMSIPACFYISIPGFLYVSLPAWTSVQLLSKKIQYVMKQYI